MDGLVEFGELGQGRGRADREPGQDRTGQNGGGWRQTPGAEKASVGMYRQDSTVRVWGRDRDSTGRGQAAPSSGGGEAPCRHVSTGHGPPCHLSPSGDRPRLGDLLETAWPAEVTFGAVTTLGPIVLLSALARGAPSLTTLLYAVTRPASRSVSASLTDSALSIHCSLPTFVAQHLVGTRDGNSLAL